MTEYNNAWQSFGSRLLASPHSQSRKRIALVLVGWERMHMHQSFLVFRSKRSQLAPAVYQVANLVFVDLVFGKWSSTVGIGHRRDMRHHISFSYWCHQIRAQPEVFIAGYLWRQVKQPFLSRVPELCAFILNTFGPCIACHAMIRRGNRGISTRCWEDLCRVVSFLHSWSPQANRFDERLRI